MACCSFLSGKENRMRSEITFSYSQRSVEKLFPIKPKGEGKRGDYFNVLSFLMFRRACEHISVSVDGSSHFLSVVHQRLK